MKKLKFMLAAAAAIGLSSASQASYYNGSTNFEDSDYVAGAVVDDNTADRLFQFTGTAGDNESTIVEEAVNFGGDRPFQYRGTADTKYLQVSTGTDPLLRKIRNAPESIPAGGAIYVDTLVQFTVTPATDEVTANAADKLMIYVQQTTNSVGEVDGTNLVVKAASIVEDPFTFEQTIVPTDVIVSNGFDVASWYRLTVKSYVDNGLLLFNIFLDGQQLSMSAPLAGDDVSAFPSLLGGTDLQIAGVGFAGEGKVDDLSFTTDAFPTALDFTLAWPSGYTAVSYMIGSATPVNIDGSAASPVHIAPYAGDTVRFSFQNADGVSKTMELVAASDATSLNAADATFGWADYLGDADGSGAYVIDDLDELVLFKKGVAKFGTSGETFKLGGNIDATDLGYFDGIGTASGTNGSSGLNNCTFDGAGYTISNVKFTPAKYRGFFNQVLNSTIKDLTINVVDIQQTDAAEHGYSAFAGNLKNSKILNCKATGTLGTTAKPTMHTTAGFAVKVDSAGVFVNCTNAMDIVCSLNDNPKVGGIAGLFQGGALTNCWNEGNITITCKKCKEAGNGAGGLIGYAQTSATTIYGGGNTGTIQSTNTTANGGSNDVKVGTIIGMQNNSTATVAGGTVAQADAAPAGAFANISGLNFATVDGNVATYVADSALAAGNTYKVMNAATATYEFDAPGTIAFDTALATPSSYAITAVEGLGVKDAVTVGNVTTYTAAKGMAEHPWYENPAAVVLAEDLPTQQAAGPSSFHGQGQDEFLGLTFGTNPLQFNLYTVDGTNALTTVTSVAATDATNPGFRGVAISKTLGIAMTLAYAKDTTMYAFPLAGGAPTAVNKGTTHGFDSGAFSPDGQYFFSNAIEGEESNQYIVKWSVSVANGVITLTKVGSISAGGRARNLAYGRINGRDLVFVMAETGKIVVVEMTGDSGWTATDLVTGLPTISYGSICLSGVNAYQATPTLTVATSVNKNNSGDVLNVYALTVPASGAVTATLTKTFDHAAMTAAGFGTLDIGMYGNTVYVTDDNETIYFGRPDRKLYAAQYYVAPAAADWAADSSSIPANTSAATQYPALADSALASADAKELTDWAKENSIAFADVAADTTGTYTDAFLLNCAVAAVAEEEEDFVLDISVGADGTITVSLPEGKEYNGKLQMKGSNDLSTWTDVNAASSSYKFYKYVLSL